MAEITDVWITDELLHAFSGMYSMGKVFDALSLAEKTKLARMVSGRWASFNWLPGMEPTVQDGMTYARDLDSALTTAFGTHVRWLGEQSGSSYAAAMKDRATNKVSFLSDVPIMVRNALVGNYVYDVSLDETGLDRQRDRGRATELAYEDL